MRATRSRSILLVAAFGLLGVGSVTALRQREVAAWVRFRYPSAAEAYRERARVRRVPGKAEMAAEDERKAAELGAPQGRDP